MIKKSLDQSRRGINKLSMKLFISIIFDIYLTTFKLAGYNSKYLFQREHKIFIIKSYYSNGDRRENGNWVYLSSLCLNEFHDRLALL
jgi:hypothetical protein